MASDAHCHVFVLNVHADYACRRSGACCAAGWDVPVEPETAEHLERARHDGRMSLPGGTPGLLVRTPPPPDGAAAILARDAAGTCVLLDPADGNACRVHRDLGPGRLPATCRQFPRIALLDPRGVHVTLSHFCPTAAASLVRDDRNGLRIVRDPAAFASWPGYEGFDATRTIPPFLRPGAVFDLEAYSRWESWQVDVLGREASSAERALGTIALAAELLRTWRPPRGPLCDAVDHATAAADAGAGSLESPAALDAPGRLSRAARTFGRVVERVPAGLAAPSVPPDLVSAATEFVAPPWTDFSTAVRRYLAAKAFGSWSAYQGEGVRTGVAVMALVLDVLLVESVRQAGSARRPLDAPLLVEAFRHSDLLLEHLVDRADLTDLAAGAERAAPERFLSGFPL